MRVCVVQPPVTKTSLSCITGGSLGYVQAEYWNMPFNTFSMPDIATYTNPGESRGGKKL